jgi:signal transduction histidine kinase
MPFTLVSTDNTVVYSNEPGEVGQQVSQRDLSRAVQLTTVNGQTAGWLFLVPMNRVWVANSPEARFLQNINQAALVSAGIAAALALTLGGLLAFTMTRSLREMTEATVEIAKGQLGRQVKVRSRDELGELAESFNKMSRDLAKATQARQQMTVDIAHDLRSPLSVISGYAEALSDGKLPGNPEVYTILHQETQQLSRLIEDLRTLSLADAGELPLNIQPADPQALLERVAARHALTAQQKRIALKVEPGRKSRVRVDSERMVQVFDNLVVNAFRYTPAGGEVILSSKPENGDVQLQVCDNGSGIAAEDLPHIFDRFYRGSLFHGDGESGLGLAIAKTMVEAQGGSLTAASTPGQGAVFTIRLKAE